eukprot:752856-Rhodomonas_salina.2
MVESGRLSVWSFASRFIRTRPYRLWATASLSPFPARVTQIQTRTGSRYTRPPPLAREWARAPRSSSPSGSSAVSSIIPSSPAFSDPLQVAAAHRTIHPQSVEGGDGLGQRGVGRKEGVRA